jgi:hypothetical protein
MMLYYSAHYICYILTSQGCSLFSSVYQTHMITAPPHSNDHYTTPHAVMYYLDPRISLPPGDDSSVIYVYYILTLAWIQYLPTLQCDRTSSTVTRACGLRFQRCARLSFDISLASLQ